MAIDRVTVSLDEDAKGALDDLTERTGHGQSELFRRALTFYAANYRAATTDAGTKLGDYHKMLSGGEHVLLDVDFLHCFLDYVSDSDDEPDPSSWRRRTGSLSTTLTSTTASSSRSTSYSNGFRCAGS